MEIQLTQWGFYGAFIAVVSFVCILAALEQRIGKKFVAKALIILFSIVSIVTMLGY
jgi:predicted PurR-regulated permease PerM